MSDTRPSNLLMGFIGDDFTGSTDAMESLALQGIRTVLFTEFPSDAQLKQYPDLKAFGVAGLTRSLPTELIAEQIRPMFVAMREIGVPIVHYKTCSTFDSSPTVGSIGRVIDVGMEALRSRFVPVVVGAPALGRYCAFGNLFARCGGDPEIYRLDRHPSMSRHPVTPMGEGDLRRHLGKQTSKVIALLDVLTLEMPFENVRQRLELIIGDGAKIVLVDVLYERHLEAIGSLLTERAKVDRPLFVVGSSGVESALCADWVRSGIATGTARFERSRPARPIIALCGSCSPVTGGQIKWAVAHDFVEVAVDVDEASADSSRSVANSIAAIRRGKNVCIHTGGKKNAGFGVTSDAEIGAMLGRIFAAVVKETPVRRAVVAGGDTSSQVARALEISAVEMIGELTRGSPLCKASSSNPAVDGLEITFKGGQIGGEDFFGLVRDGS